MTKTNSPETSNGRTTYRLIAIATLGLAALAGTPVTACAQASDSAAVTAISNLYSALQTIEAPKAGTVAARAGIIGPVVDQVFDLPSILKGSVGMGYASLSDVEKQKLLAAFREYTIARYISSFKPGAGAQFTVAPTTAPAAIGGGTMVATTIGSATDAPVAINYVMKPIDGSYRIVDVLYNKRVSQVAAQRSEFSHTLSTGGADALAGQLSTKAHKLMND